MNTTRLMPQPLTTDELLACDRLMDELLAEDAAPAPLCLARLAQDLAADVQEAAAPVARQVAQVA
ncbi:hypothetical protein DSM112329_05062 [Paraconexibacter sp. AEG42_29]|uniref:Uncharacterized protein n=1 Tax=Paraconexibacter sp. AEG42_29 TaxID=2997339 RepID=A0AAU7B2S5_9ACTN